MLKLKEQLDIEGMKRKNIIEMGLGYTAMIRIFSQKSKAKIEAKLEELFSHLAEISTRDDYESCHRSFCEWFTREVRTAEKNLSNGGLQPSQQSSFGQAAKVLDIAIKVYVYYCAQPTPEIAQRIVPLLHGAIDTPILAYLKKCKSATLKINATTIKGVDLRVYRDLQSILLAESLSVNLHPVEFEDLLWRQLNR